MKRIIAAAVLTVAMSVQAQNNNGGISAEMLDEIRNGYSDTPAEKAVRNALAGQSIAVLAVNADNAAMIDTHFSNRVLTKGITDQKSSGRCWLFTGLNVLRAKMIAKHDLGEFTFSQNYVSFYDLLEKSNLFLQAMIDNSKSDITDRKVDWLFQNPIGDGGQFTGVSNLIMKYGVVPSDVMPETYQSNNTSEMRAVLSKKLRQFGLELRGMKTADAIKRKTEMLTEIYGILAKCLGVPPTSFEWTRYDSKGNFVSRKTYTPKDFYNEFVGQDLENNYIMVMNDPSRDYYRTYEIEYDRHVYDGDNWVYVNLPVERIKEMAIASIKDSTAMYFSCDVRKFANTSKGTLDLANMDYESLFDTDFPMDKKQRIQTYASGSSHAMTLIAVDLDDRGNPVKWMVENSWGASSGYKGNLIMTDEWFNEYMFRLVLEKKYVPSDILDVMKKKPVMLPSWDPMFLPEE
ncbi:MAG: C1 family peptidase [Bacteroidaceae bacterium]|nr:C1 family peptidase [Bacteroidaceae bacterium]